MAKLDTRWLEHFTTIAILYFILLCCSHTWHEYFTESMLGECSNFQITMSVEAKVIARQYFR